MPGGRGRARLHRWSLVRWGTPLHRLAALARRLTVDYGSLRMFQTHAKATPPPPVKPPERRGELVHGNTPTGSCPLCNPQNVTLPAKILAIGEEFRKTIAAHIKYTYRFLKDSWFWLWEPLLFYIAVLLVALPIIASFLWPDKNVIRYAGLFLQLLGVGTVAWDILETRKFFDLLSIWKEAHQRFRRWLCDRPKYRRGIVVELETGTGVGVGSSDIRFVETKTSPDAAVEEKYSRH